MTEILERPAQSSQYKVVGTRPIRHDGLDKVTGRAKFGADMFLPGMLYGKILRSPHPHAILKSIDTSAAEALRHGRDLERAGDADEVDAVVADAVTLERVGRAGDELIDDERVEPGRDQREPPGR